MTTTHEIPRIYVACLAAYNAGRLHGTWIDCNQDADTIGTEIAEMLARSPEPGAEEWAIHDHEHWNDLKLSEFESILDLAQAAAGIEDHGPVFAALMAHLGGLRYLDEATTMMTDNYLGSWPSFRAFAEEQADELLLPSIPEPARHYFDYEAWTRDLELSGEYLAIQDAASVHLISLT